MKVFGCFKFSYLALSATALLLFSACQETNSTVTASGPGSPLEIFDLNNPDAIPGEYIVTLNDNFTNPLTVSASGMSRLGLQASEFKALNIYKTALNGFAAKLTPQGLESLRRNPNVKRISANVLIHLDLPVEQFGAISPLGEPPKQTQANTQWGLERLSRRAILTNQSTATNHSYTYTYTGSGVHVYVMDSGIDATNADFQTRLGSGYSAVNDTNGTTDCLGHGTHVAGTIGGKLWGVAKDVTIHAVRVIDCNDNTTKALLIAGVDWIKANRQTPAIVNMSLAKSTVSSTDLIEIDNAIKSSLDTRTLYVVAAGNGTALTGNLGTDACNFTPARLGNTGIDLISVGATAINDTVPSFSNYGNCVDAFAPGKTITSDWSSTAKTTPGSQKTIDGTSMASPHVAGVAALYWQLNPAATASQVRATILARSTKDVLPTSGTGAIRSPYNRLISALAVPTACFTVTSQSNTNFSLRPKLADDPTTATEILSYEWDYGDATIKDTLTTASTVQHAYPNFEQTYSATLTLKDKNGGTQSCTVPIRVTPVLPTGANISYGIGYATFISRVNGIATYYLTVNIETPSANLINSTDSNGYPLYYNPVYLGNRTYPSGGDRMDENLLTTVGAKEVFDKWKQYAKPGYTTYFVKSTSASSFSCGGRYWSQYLGFKSAAEGGYGFDFCFYVAISPDPKI
jgi:hypothetical protein